MKNFFKDHLLEILLVLFVLMVIAAAVIAIASGQPSNMDASLANPASPIYQAFMHHVLFK